MRTEIRHVRVCLAGLRTGLRQLMLQIILPEMHRNSARPCPLRTSSPYRTTYASNHARQPWNAPDAQHQRLLRTRRPESLEPPLRVALLFSDAHACEVAPPVLHTRPWSTVSHVLFLKGLRFLDDVNHYFLLFLLVLLIDSKPSCPRAEVMPRHFGTPPLCNGMPHAEPLHILTRTTPIFNNFLTPFFMCCLSKPFFFLMLILCCSIFLDAVRYSQYPRFCSEVLQSS